MIYNKNIILIFLFVMLSFAIISEVSAGSGAEADGTGFDQSLNPANVTLQDLPSENNDNSHDFDENIKFQNEQNSLRNSSEFEKGFYENIYGDDPDNLSIAHDFHDDDRFLDGDYPIDFNFTEGKNTHLDSMLINFNFSNEVNPTEDLKENGFMVTPNYELMDNILSNLLGLSNIAPNFKR